MTVFFVKDATTTIPAAATDNDNPATGNASPLWAGIARPVGNYTRDNVVADSILNRVTQIDSVKRFSVMTSIIEIPILDADIPVNNNVRDIYIKIPFANIDIGGTQQLYGLSVLGYKKTNPAAADFDFISAFPHYGQAPADGNTPIRVISSVYSDRDKIVIQITKPSNAAAVAGIISNAMLRNFLVGNSIVLQILTSK